MPEGPQRAENALNALSEERELQTVIAGIPRYTDPGSIKEEMESEGFIPTSISPLITKSHPPVNSFLMKLKRDGLYADIYNLTYLMYLRVQVKVFNADIHQNSATSNLAVWDVARGIMEAAEFPALPLPHVKLRRKPRNKLPRLC